MISEGRDLKCEIAHVDHGSIKTMMGEENPLVLR